jgi:SSS family solute:Na+ symporter
MAETTSETLIVLIVGYVACFVLAGMNAFVSAKKSAPGLPKKSAWGAYTTVALFGVLSGWALPQMIAEYGLPAGYGALMIIAMAVVMTLLSKRLWVLARRYQTQSQVTIVRLYFRDDGLAGMVSVLNGVTCLVLLALIFHLVGSVTSFATGLGIFGFYTGAAAIAIVGYVYYLNVGMDRASLAATLSLIIYIIGVVGLGIAVLSHMGGFAGLGAALEQHVASSGKFPTTEGHGGGDFPAVFALSGVYQSVMSVPGDFYVGGPWTGLMVLSASICTVGICVSQIGFGQMIGGFDTRRLSADLVVRFGLLGGGVAVIFGIAAGVGALVGIDVNILKIMAGDAPHVDGIVSRIGFTVFGILIFMSGTAVILGSFATPVARSQDNAAKSHIKIAMLAGFAGLLAFTPLLQLIDYTTLVLALSAQLLLPLFAICWVPWFTRAGIYAGLVSGIIVVLLTDFPGLLIQQAMFDGAVWGASPMTMHAAGWGLLVNMVVVICVSAVTQSSDDLGHRIAFHDDLQTYAPIDEEARGLVPVAWIFTIAWFLFALGPGAVIGNSIFGAPDQPVQGWNFSVPSIWAWQIFMWALGVALIWFLTTRLGVSRPVEGVVEPIDKSQESG